MVKSIKEMQIKQRSVIKIDQSGLSKSYKKKIQ